MVEPAGSVAFPRGMAKRLEIARQDLEAAAHRMGLARVQLRREPRLLEPLEQAAEALDRAWQAVLAAQAASAKEEAAAAAAAQKAGPS